MSQDTGDAFKASSHDASKASSHDAFKASSHDASKASSHDAFKASSHDAFKASSHDAFKASMEICWQFAYQFEREKLAQLYSKSKQLQWDAERDVDWSTSVDPSRPLIDERHFMLERLGSVKRLAKPQREELRAHVAANHLSQFLHGEQGALMTAAALTHAVPDYEAKLYAATQTMDEARHVEVFQRYIDRLGMIYPMNPWLKRLIDLTLAADTWVKTAIGMNMVVEGLALGTFHNMAAATQCGLLRQVLGYVIRDEARHVGFGHLYVADAIAAMDEPAREDVADFAFDAVSLMRQSRASRAGTFDDGFLMALDRVGLDPNDLVADIVALRASGEQVEVPRDQVHSFRDLMMPALVRVGAITPRSRERYQAEGIPVWEDRRALEEMETRGGHLG